MNAHRRLALPARAALAILLPLLGGAAARADMQLAVSPDPPTWQDEVTVTASGDRYTACGSWAFTLTPLGTIATGTPTSFGLRLSESCPILAPATLRHVEVSAKLPRLAPGSYSLVMEEAAGGPSVVLPMRVWQAGVASLLAPAVVTDDQPAVLRAVFPGLSSSVVGVSGSVRGQVIDLAYNAVNIVSPPPPGPVVGLGFDTPVTLAPLQAGDYQVLIEDGYLMNRARLRVWRHDGCLPGPGALCLQHGRFRVTATWRDFAGRTGTAQAQPLPGSEDSGLLSFFAPDNAELTVKTLDGCGVNGHWWVFVAAGSTVQYDVTVEDTVGGTRRGYHNGLGVAAPLVDDTTAFACP